MKSEYTIMVDSREKMPLIFPRSITMLDDKFLPHKRKPIKVSVLIEKTDLRTGDYLLREHPTRIIIERKGHLGEVATNCLTPTGRRRFVYECERLRSECDLPIVMLEGSVAQLVRTWRGDHSPWLVVDALQRLCIEHGIALRFVPTTATASKRAMGEEVAHLLINGAITCLPANLPTSTCTPTEQEAPSLLPTKTS